MFRFFDRIVALSLVPCLMVDPALAEIFPSHSAPIIHIAFSSHDNQRSLFTDQALVSAVLWMRRALENQSAPRVRVMAAAAMAGLSVGSAILQAHVPQVANWERFLLTLTFIGSWSAFLSLLLNIQVLPGMAMVEVSNPKPQQEILDIVDDQNHVVGQIGKDDAHKQGIQHRGVTILLVAPDGRVVFQRRAPNKKTFAGRLDVSVAGHVKSGTTYDETAQAEISEESPVPIDFSRLESVEIEGGYFKADIKDPAIGHNRELKKVYVVRLNQSEADQIAGMDAEKRRFWEGYAINPGGAFTRTQMERIRDKARQLRPDFEQLLDLDRQKTLQEAEAFFEIAGYQMMTLGEAAQRYEKAPSDFADGYYSVFGRSYPNGEINARAEIYIQSLQNKLSSLVTEAYKHFVLPGVQILRGGQSGAYISDQEPVALADEKTGKPLAAQAERRVAHKQGLWHQTVHVYFIDSKGRFVLQRRSRNLAVSPGKLQASVSGHVDAADLIGIQSFDQPEWVKRVAAREGLEEMGITLDMDRLEMISGINEIRRDQHENKEFTTVFSYHLTDEELEQVQAKYDLNEVEELALMPAENLQHLTENYPNEFSGSIRYLIKNYPYLLQRLLLPSDPLVDLRNKTSAERVSKGIELVRKEHRALADVMEDPSVRDVAECLIALNPKKVLIVGDALWPLMHLFLAMGVLVIYVDKDPAPVRFNLAGMQVLKILHTDVDKLHLSPWNTYASLSGGTFDLALLLSLVGPSFAGNLTQALHNVGSLLADGGRLYVSNEPIRLGHNRTMIDEIKTLFPGSEVDPHLPQIVTRYDIADRNVLEYLDAANVCIQLRKAA